MLNQPKPDLQLQITNDLNNLNKNYKTPFTLNKKSQIEDIETSLATIKTSLANTSYSLADQQEQKALVVTISDGPPVRMQKKDDGKGGKNKGNVDEDVDEDEDKTEFDFVKRFVNEKRKKDNEALDEYHKKIQQDFNEKQNEFVERQQKQKFSKQGDLNKNAFKASGQFKEDANQPPKLLATAGNKQAQDSKLKTRLSKSLGALSKDKNSQAQKPEEEKSNRIKKSDVNPAAEGAKLDRKGIKYSGEKGNKSFFNKRKQDIERLNERLGLGGGIYDDQSEEDMTEWQGGNVNEEEIKKFDLQLPAIKGYKVDSLNLGAAGERVLSKYEAGYQSDQSQKSKNMFNTQDPGTKKLLQTLEGKYRKGIPSSVKDENDGKNASDDFEREKINSFKQSNEIKSIPVYKPPSGGKKKFNDWRDGNKSSSDDELPDPKQVIDRIKQETQIEDPRSKLSIMAGDQTNYEELKKDETPKQNQVNVDNTNSQQKPVRSTIFNKPPRSSILIASKKQPEDQKSQEPSDLKSKIQGSLGKSLGMTSKGSPRLSDQSQERISNVSFHLAIPSNQNQKGSVSQQPQSRSNQRGKHSGQSKQTQPSQSKKNTPQTNKYLPPSQRRKNKPQQQETLWGGEDSDDRRKRKLQNRERLLQLAQPKPKQYVLVKEDDEEENENEHKAKQLLEQMEKGKSINFSDYVDRDIPYIKNNIHGIEAQKNQSKEFDTKVSNKSGLFSKIKDNDKASFNNTPGEVRYIQDKKVKKVPGKSPNDG